MTSLSIRIYFTANFLIAACMFFIFGFTGDTCAVAVIAFLISLMISIPSGFALYFCFLIINETNYSILWRWLCFIIGVFVTALIPYSIACGISTSEFATKETSITFYLSEGSAFGATLLNSLAIHRHFKTPSNEIF